MTSWVAVGFGALTVPGDDVSTADSEYVITPVLPSSPRILFGEGAALWQQLLNGPVPDDSLTMDRRRVVREMEELGLASSDLRHPARIHKVTEPWLISAHHELVYALLAHVAEQSDIDIVFIKGPTLHAQGLRTRAHSGDVDCWVSPGDEARLAFAMIPWGWTPAFSPFTGTRVLHSLTLRAGGWGCAIDVHSWFPGMTIEPDQAFAMASRVAEFRSFAGQAVKTPPLGLHAVMAALHDLRPLEGRTATTAQLTAVSEMLRDAGPVAIQAVREVGAAYALKDALRLAFPEHDFDFDSAAVPPDWAWRSESSQFGVYREALKLIPPSERPLVIFRIIWPRIEALRWAATNGSEGIPTLGDVALRRRHLMGLIQKIVRRPQS